MAEKQQPRDGRIHGAHNLLDNKVVGCPGRGNPGMPAVPDARRRDRFELVNGS